MDFQSPLFANFNDSNQQESTLLNNLQYVIYVIALRIMNQLHRLIKDIKILVHYLCTYAEKKGTIGKNWKFLKKNIWKNLNSFKKLGKDALNWGIALFSAVYKPH